MVIANKMSKSGSNAFFYNALMASFQNLLDTDDASFLARALISKKSYTELLEFLESPIVVVKGENSLAVDNAFIKRQLIENGQFEILDNLEKAKIIVSNCSNISIKGLDVVYMFGNTVRLLAPGDEDELKADVFVAKENKIINTINSNIEFSIGNSFKSIMHTNIEKMKNTRVFQMNGISNVPTAPALNQSNSSQNPTYTK